MSFSLDQDSLRPGEQRFRTRLKEANPQPLRTGRLLQNLASVAANVGLNPKYARGNTGSLAVSRTLSPLMIRRPTQSDRLESNIDDVSSGHVT